MAAEQRQVQDRVAEADASPMRGRYVPALDGVRGLSVAAVFLFHAFGTHSVYRHAALVRLGHLGVEAFFVLSGFLITLRLWALGDRAEWTLGQRWKVFGVRRAARIVPLYFAVLTLLALFGHDLGFEVLDGAWPWYFAYAANILIFAGAGWIGAGGHFWSLCVEEQFYLVFPPFVLTSARRWLVPIAVSLAIACVALRVGLAGRTGRAAWAWVLAPLHLDAFGAGILSAVFARKAETRAPADRATHLVYALGALCATLFIALAWDQALGARWAALLPTLLAFAVGALVIALWRNAATSLSAVLGFPLLAGIGRISYGIYIVHLFVIVWVWRIRAPWLPPVALLRGTIAWTLSVTLAALSWFAFERPILRAGQRYRPRLGPGSASVTPRPGHGG